MKYVIFNIHHRLFVGISSYLKISRNCLWLSHFLIKTELQSTLQEFVKIHPIWFHEGTLK